MEKGFLHAWACEVKYEGFGRWRETAATPRKGSHAREFIGKLEVLRYFAYNRADVRGWPREVNSHRVGLGGHTVAYILNSKIRWQYNVEECYSRIIYRGWEYGVGVNTVTTEVILLHGIYWGWKRPQTKGQLIQPPDITSTIFNDNKWHSARTIKSRKRTRTQW